MQNRRNMVVAAVFAFAVLALVYYIAVVFLNIGNVPYPMG